MPKKIPRPPGPDDWAADRIRYEREKRGWSTAELARRITEAGVPMRQQQVWQVESGEPRRRLSVGEAAAFAKVLGLSIADLMTPPEQIAAKNLIELGRAFAEWRRDAGVLAARLREIADRVSQLEDDERYTASVVAKFGGMDELADQTLADLEQVTTDYGHVVESIREHGSIWSVMASMRYVISDEESRQ